MKASPAKKKKIHAIQTVCATRIVRLRGFTGRDVKLVMVAPRQTANGYPEMDPWDGNKSFGTRIARVGTRWVAPGDAGANQIALKRGAQNVKPLA